MSDPTAPLTESELRKEIEVTWRMTERDVRLASSILDSASAILRQAETVTKPPAFYVVAMYSQLLVNLLMAVAIGRYMGAW